MMTARPDPPTSMRAALLCEETPDKSAYEEYRASLDRALMRVERRGRITFHACWVSLLLAWGLSLLGGLRAIGSFDPYDKTANASSIAMGAIFVLACITFPLSLASLYSRIRPRLQRIKDDIRDAQTGELQREVEAVRAPRADQTQ